MKTARVPNVLLGSVTCPLAFLCGSPLLLVFLVELSRVQLSAQDVIRVETAPPPPVRPAPDPYVHPRPAHPGDHIVSPLPPQPLHVTKARFHGDSFGPYFLPPLAPILGETIQVFPSANTQRLPDATATTPSPPRHERSTLTASAAESSNAMAMAEHIGEIYSVPLSYLFAEFRHQVGRSYFIPGEADAAYSGLPGRAGERLSQYLRDRRTALDSLRAQLARIETAPADQRLAQRTAFAANQTPSLLDLENEAEAIRAELTENGLMKNPARDIGTVPPERVRDAAKRKAQEAVIDALSSAQFHSGLSLEQRLLLNEVSVETALAFPDPSNPTDRTAERAVFFWPAGARIRLPDQLPPDLSQAFSAFQSLKAKLKKELVATIQRERARIFPSDRTAVYRQLASTQADRFERLDTLAEEIRHRLVELPAFDAPFKSKLPPDLVHRLGQAGETKAALHRDLAARLEEFRRDLPDQRVELVRKAQAVVISVTPLSDRRPPQTDTQRSVLHRLETVNQELIRRFTALDIEYTALREDLASYRASLPPAASGTTIETLLAGFAQDYAAQENWNRYRDYRAAVLLPGLSPAQRRLLFNAAQVALFKESRQISP